MHCSACGSYYRLSVFNKTCFCEACLVQQDDLYDTEDSSTKIDTDNIVNRSGRTMPVFYDDDDSHGL